MKRTVLRGAAVVVAVTLGLVGCSAPEQGSVGEGGATAGGALNIGNFADVTSWDPAGADIGFDGPYLSAVYDPLVTLDEAGEPAPALATDWTVSEDKRTVTMDLRSDVTFSDGQVFDAAAAVANLERLKDGARSRDAYTAVSGFSVVDADTITISLKERDDTLLYFMGLGRSWMASPAALEGDALAKAPVGSGPYTLSDASVAGSEYRFEKKRDHWNAKSFTGDPLAIFPIADATARNNAMAAGQINVNYADHPAIVQAESMGWNQAETAATWVGLQFSGRADEGGSEAARAVTKLEVRQAINHAFDGAKLLQALAEGDGVDAQQTFPEGTPGYDVALNSRYGYDVDQAKQLLAQAGYPDGFDITLPVTAAFAALQPTVEQNLGAIGIKVKWDSMQYIDYQAKVGTYPMFMARLAMYSNPIANVVRGVKTPMWYNPKPGMESIPGLKDAVQEVLTAEPSAQPDLVKKLNGVLSEQAYFDVWFQGNNTYVSAPGVTIKPLTGQMFPTLNRITVASS
ncbi:MAG: ABC transporter substrate-binding protein [Arthrobacter sp.]|jgi:peptide/nickel transport system substrate-binding protein|nr:ABC transporter substrate-binding protein [Arthrobacter sp.]